MGPYQVKLCILNSYQLETLTGKPVEGTHSAQRLRRFTAKSGMQLAADQALFMAEMHMRKAEEVNLGRPSKEEVAEDRKEEQDIQEMDEGDEESAEWVQGKEEIEEAVSQSKGCTGEEQSEEESETTDNDSLGGVAR